MKEPIALNSSVRTPPIDSRHGDIECFLGFASGRYTRTHGPFWFGIALVLTVLSWIALIPVLVGFQGSGLGELRPRLTRGGTSCRSLLAESDRLWGMISHAHFQARATLGARGKLGKISLFFVTESDGVSSVANWQVEVTIPCPVVEADGSPFRKHPVAG